MKVSHIYKGEICIVICANGKYVELLEKLFIYFIDIDESFTCVCGLGCFGGILVCGYLCSGSMLEDIIILKHDGVLGITGGINISEVYDTVEDIIY